MAWTVKFERVSKRYGGGGPRYATLRDDLAQLGQKAVALMRGGTSGSKGTLALDELSFEVNEGEAFAIIGPNGAGKTTALKLITRISYPTSGRVRVRGRVGALIEVGTGLHPELTGRENISLYGRIMGMGRREISRQFDAIVDFAELPDALDMPVKMYSYGMQLRLGFAIASHLDPHIFVVDEALAVGDTGFQAKCANRLMRLVAEGRSLLLVSHNLFVVENLCNRGILLMDGRLQGEGGAREIVQDYLARIDAGRIHDQNSSGRTYRSVRDIQITSVTCHDLSGSERYSFGNGDDIEVRIHLDVKQAVGKPIVSLGITDGRPGAIALASMQVDGNVPRVLEGPSVVRCRFKSVPLLPGVYEIMGSVVTEHGWGELVDWQPFVSFRIASPAGRDFRGQTGVGHMASAPVSVDYEWSWQAEGNS